MYKTRTPKILCYLFVFSLFFFSKIDNIFAAQIYDMATSSNYNIRYDGDTSDGRLGYNSHVYQTDINNNGIDDLIIGDPRADHGGTNIGSIYIIYDSLLAETTGIGNTIDLSDSSSYSLRIDGPTDSSLFGKFKIISLDITYDGKNDLIISNGSATYNGSGSGSVFVIPNNIIANITGTGNSISLDTTSNFLMRIDGMSGAAFGAGVNAISIADIDNNGKNDMIIGADQDGASNKGAVYVFYDNLLDNYTGSGNTFNMDTSSNYNIKFTAETNGDELGLNIKIDDIDGNSKGDLVFGDRHANNNSRANSGSIYYINNSIFSEISGTGNTLALQTSSNYTIRYDGVLANGNLGGGTLNTGDIDGNGHVDFLFNEDATEDGYVFVIYDSLIDNYSGSGNNVDLATGSSYNIRIDGNTGDDLGFTSVNVADINNDGKGELLLHALSDYNSRANSGSMYVLNQSNLSSLTGTGNILPLSNSSNYSQRYDGASTSQYFSYSSITHGDFNNDGSIDFALGALDISGGGNVYVIYNFPHTNTLTTNKNQFLNNGRKLTGTIAAPSSVTNISGVQWSSNNDTNGTWTNCNAIDGSFNSLEENYSCSVSGEPDIVYIRSYDENTSYTAVISYTSLSLVDTGIIDTNNHIRQDIQPNDSSGFFFPIEDSDTGLQKVVIMIQNYTFNFHAFVSAKNTKANTILIQNSLHLSSRKNQAFMVGGGNNIIGFRTNSGTAWQVGNIQNIWYKAFAAKDSNLEPAKIIPDIQRKPSILSLSYTNKDLIPAGQRKNPFNPSILKLARSLDGQRWVVLQHSVVDTVNQTVSIYDTIGGYYTIVANVQTYQSNDSQPEATTIQTDKINKETPQYTTDSTTKAAVLDSQTKKENETFLSKILNWLF